MCSNYVIADCLKVNGFYTKNIISQYIDRFSENILTRSECRVLRFIFDRTINWGKLSEQISFRHFIDGVESDDRVICKGVGYSESTIRKALKGLLEKGIIIKNNKSKVSTFFDQIGVFQINFNNEFFYNLNMTVNKITIKVPKNKDVKSKGDPLRNSGDNNINKYNSEKKVESKFQHNNDDDDKLKKLLEDIKNNSKKRADNKILDIKSNDKTSVSDFIQLWVYNIKNSNYEYKDVVITGKEKGQIKHILSVLRTQLSSFKDGRKTDGILISEFIEFVVSNWSIITNKQFKNIREKNPDKFPKNPSLQFLLAFYKVFINYAWNYKNGIKIEEEELELNDYQKEVMRLVRSGVSIDSARVEASRKFNNRLIAKEISVDNLKDTLSKDKKDVQMLKEELSSELIKVKKGTYLEEKERVVDEALSRIKKLEKSLIDKESELKAREDYISKKELAAKEKSLSYESNSEVQSLIDEIVKISNDLSFVPERAIGEDDSCYIDRLNTSLDLVKTLYL